MLFVGVVGVGVVLWCVLAVCCCVPPRALPKHHSGLLPLPPAAVSPPPPFPHLPISLSPYTSPPSSLPYLSPAPLTLSMNVIARDAHMPTTPGGRPCASTRRQSSPRPSASCRTPLVVKSNAAAVPPVESHQLTVRWRCASCFVGGGGVVVVALLVVALVVVVGGGGVYTLVAAARWPVFRRGCLKHRCRDCLQCDPRTLSSSPITLSPTTIHPSHHSSPSHFTPGCTRAPSRCTCTCPSTRQTLVYTAVCVYGR